MLGLLKKDIIMIKSNLKVLVIIFAVYILMYLQGSMDISFLLPFMGFSLCYLLLVLSIYLLS